MSVNAKRDEFKREDLLALAEVADIKMPRAHQMIDQVIEVFRRWPDFAAEAGIPEEQIMKIQKRLCTDL
jgi:serine/threonine-protein kinase HipA